MAHATLLDTFPEVIRISWLLPSASNEKGTPEEAEDEKGCCLERGSEPCASEKAKQRADKWGWGDVIHHSNQQPWTSGDDTAGPLAVSLIAECSIMMSDVLRTGTNCICILPFNSCVTMDKLLNFSEP